MIIFLSQRWYSDAPCCLLGAAELPFFPRPYQSLTARQSLTSELEAAASRPGSCCLPTWKLLPPDLEAAASLPTWKLLPPRYAAARRPSSVSPRPSPRTAPRTCDQATAVAGTRPRATRDGRSTGIRSSSPVLICAPFLPKE